MIRNRLRSQIHSGTRMGGGRVLEDTPQPDYDDCCHVTIRALWVCGDGSRWSSARWGGAQRSRLAERCAKRCCPKWLKGPILGGYLIGNLGRRVPGRPPPTGYQISAGDEPGTATLPAPRELAVMVPNLGFPGLRRFSECRRHPPSQLLQIATLAYI